jgi:signal transduction histidine kinase
VSYDTHGEVTIPLELPRLNARDRRRSLATALAIVGAVALVDTLVYDTGARTLVWGGWLFLYAAAAVLTGRFTRRVDLVVGGAAGLVAVAAAAALAVLSGGTRSPFFFLLLVIPLLSALSAPEDLLDTALLGVASAGCGAWLLLREQTPLFQAALWLSLTVLGTAYALVASEVHRRRQSAFLRVERERADALARLAEAERARTTIERWAAMGQVADQVTHDVNSPLGALRSSLAFAREEILGGRAEGALEALEDATACVERIRVIVAELGSRGGFPHAGSRGRAPPGQDDPERG